MLTPSLVLYLLIVSCEAAFWLVLLLGLVARYLLHREGYTIMLTTALALLVINGLAYYFLFAGNTRRIQFLTTDHCFPRP